MKIRFLLIIYFTSLSGILQNCNTQTVYPDCNSTPDYDATLLASTPVSGSHNFGTDCQTGCHSSGGSAQAIWTVAGSLEDSQGSGIPAVAGYAVSSIGAESLELTVDVCGNFYTSTPVTSIETSRPSTLNSSGMLVNSWGSVTNPGSCNQAGCHTTSAQGYIY